MIAARILLRAWNLLGRAGPFTISQRVDHDDSVLFSVGTGQDGGPEVGDGWTLVGTASRSSAQQHATSPAVPYTARAMSAPARATARRVLPTNGRTQC